MVSEINRNFLIRYKYDDQEQTKLIGGGKYEILVGSEIANKHFDKVLNGGKDKYTFKLRRGLKIDFVGK